MAQKEVNRERKNQIIARMTDDEKKKFDELVKQSGLSQSEYFRRCALKKKIYDFGIKNDMKNVQHELSKIGVNINQIAKNLNSNIYAGADQDVKKMIEQLEVIQNDFRKIILKVRSS